MPKFSLRTFLLLFAAISIVFAIVYPYVVHLQETSCRISCRNNIRQISLAMLNYESVHGHLPIGIETTADGTPYCSWRSRLVHYMESSPRYYDPDSAWDSKSNARLYDDSPVVQADKFGGNRRVEPLDPCLEYHWCCPSDSTKRVNYVVVVGEETAFPLNRTVKLDEITDGPENTILVVETLSGSDKWTEPRDLQFDSMSFRLGNSANGEAGSHHQDGVWVGFADGKIGLVSRSISAEDFRALLTIAGNEPVTRQQLIDRGLIR